jgi:hypothetical protein
VLKPRMRCYISNYDFYRTGSEDGHEDGTDIAVKKSISHTCVYLPPLLSVEATGVWMPIVK